MVIFLLFSQELLCLGWKWAFYEIRGYNSWLLLNWIVWIHVIGGDFILYYVVLWLTTPVVQPMPRLAIVTLLMKLDAFHSNLLLWKEKTIRSRRQEDYAIIGYLKCIRLSTKQQRCIHWIKRHSSSNWTQAKIVQKKSFHNAFNWLQFNEWMKGLWWRIGW